MDLNFILIVGFDDSVKEGETLSTERNVLVL